MIDNNRFLVRKRLVGKSLEVITLKVRPLMHKLTMAIDFSLFRVRQTKRPKNNFKLKRIGIQQKYELNLLRIVEASIFLHLTSLRYGKQQQNVL